MGAAAALALALGAELAIPAGAPLAAALQALREGDVLRLGPGLHEGALGRLAGVAVIGAGAGRTTVVAPPGEDGAVTAGALRLAGLTLVAGRGRSALKVLGGEARLDDVALVGGAAGAFLDGGRLEADGAWLEGDYGLLSRRGEAVLTGVDARGRMAGLALLGGHLRVRRGTVTGPSEEAGITVAGGEAELAEVVVRAPGPTGVAVTGGRLTGRSISVAGPEPVRGGFLGSCLQVRRGEVRLEASELVRCAGAAVEGSRARLSLDGVDAAGGEAGGIVLTDGSEARLDATLCTHRGPGLVVMEGSTVRAFGARLWTDPAMWVDCGSGARVAVEGEPTARQPCAAPP
jgi:hypothetical protein